MLGLGIPCATRHSSLRWSREWTTTVNEVKRASGEPEPLVGPIAVVGVREGPFDHPRQLVFHVEGRGFRSAISEPVETAVVIHRSEVPAGQTRRGFDRHLAADGGQYPEFQET